jgi:ParB-like chromosome segregation protein Spo0J
MQVTKVKINSIKTNPKNPRLIKDDKFKKLVNSIKEFPQMLELRPIVVDENNIILGGNMRHKACIEAGLKEVYIVQAKDLTEQQKDEFIVKDNVGFGEWDWDILANEWDTDKLENWGLSLPVFMDEPSYEDLIGEEKNKPASMKITFKTVEQLQEAENDIQELIDRKFQGAFYSVSAGEI